MNWMDDVNEKQMQVMYKKILDQWDNFKLTFVWVPMVNENVASLIEDTFKNGKSSIPLEATYDMKKAVMRFEHLKSGEVYEVVASEKLVEACAIDLKQVPRLTKMYIEQLICDYTLRQL